MYDGTDNLLRIFQIIITIRIIFMIVRRAIHNGRYTRANQEEQF